MKIIAYKKEYGGLTKPWKLEEIELEYRGNGTEDDPIVIDSAKKFPDQIELFESKLYINIIGLIFQGI